MTAEEQRAPLAVALLARIQQQARTLDASKVLEMVRRPMA